MSSFAAFRAHFIAIAVYFDYFYSCELYLSAGILFEGVLSRDGVGQGRICLIQVNDADAVDSLALSSIAFASSCLEYVTHMRATIIAAYFMMVTHANVWYISGVEAFRVGVPALVVKLRRR